MLEFARLPLDQRVSYFQEVANRRAEYHRPADKPMRSRLSRDCYDVWSAATGTRSNRARRPRPAAIAIKPQDDRSRRLLAFQSAIRNRRSRPHL